MPSRSLWRSPHAQLRVLINNVKQNRRLFTASAYELARVTSNDLNKKEMEFDEAELEDLNRQINKNETSLRYDPKYQCFEENEAGLLQKKLCDVYRSYEQLEMEHWRFLFHRVDEDFLRIFDHEYHGRMSRYRRMMRTAKTLYPGLEEEILRSLPGRPMSHESPKYTFAFDKAAERLETSVDVLCSMTRQFVKLFDTVYPGFV